jgi:hypothetical protein
MLFEITNLNVGDLSVDTKAILVLENLARAYREQKHIIYAKRKICKSLAESPFLGETTRAIFLQIKNKVTQIGGFAKNALIKVNIDFSETNPQKISQPTNQVTIPYSALTDSISLQKTVFLCEDSQDCSFFEYLAEYFKKQRKFFYTVMFDHFHGGGDRTKREFENIVTGKNLRFCFCLLDSDKKHPKGAVGGTAKKFSTQANPPFTHHELLNVHEAESLLPFNVLYKTITPPASSDQIDSSDYLEELERIDHPAIYYFDLKNGFELNVVMELDKNHGPFWGKLLKNIKPPTVKQGCIDNGECVCGGNCKVIHGLGKDLLPNFLKLIGKKSSQKIGELLSTTKKEMWLKWGELIFWWGCAPLSHRL